MEQLVSRIVDNVGIDETRAQTAVGMILSFLRNEGPSDQVGQLMSALPGVNEFMASIGSGEGGGGGAMALMGQLTGTGLSMGDVQGIAREVVSFAKEHAGEDSVTEVLGAIPGLSQFV